MADNPALKTFMILSDEQLKAVAALRAHISNFPFSFGVAESVDKGARRPDPVHLPEDVAVRIEIAPPSAYPHLLATRVLKAPERVPLYFYALRDLAESDTADMHVIFFIHGGRNITGHPTLPMFIQF